MNLFKQNTFDVDISGINDGAAVVVLSSNREMKSRGLKPLARILGFAEIGVDPMSMGLGPIGAVTKLVSMKMIVFYFTSLTQLFPSLNYIMLVISNVLEVD